MIFITRLPNFRQICALIIIIFSLTALAQHAKQHTALLLNIQGAIGPATSDHIQRGIKQGIKQGSPLIIIQLDTPGGLDKSMRSIIKAMLASSIPVVTYVSPSGARAASAGTFMLYASHIAAMAPGTNLGAASPVSIGGGLTPPGAKKEDKKANNKQVKKTKDTMTKKVTNDAIAYIRSLAQMRGRNVKWAEKAVREAATLTATEAKQKGVIDIVARDLTDLFKQIDGRTVTVLGKPYVIKTKNLGIEIVIPDWRTKFLSVITDPSVAYILLLMGIYGLFFEFANPGFVVPGVCGAIALILAMYAFQLLPINYAGLGLIILGIIFMVAEAFVPSFGALGIGGVIAFVVGSVLLFDTTVAGFYLAWPLIIAMAVANAGFFAIVIGMAVKARNRSIVSGRESIIGKQGKILEDFTTEGMMHLNGELWKVESSQPLKRDTIVEVIAIHGLVLTVQATTDNKGE